MNETNPTSETPKAPVSASSPMGASRPPSGPRPGGRPGFGSGPRTGARPPAGAGGGRRGGRPMMRRKVCRFCAEKIEEVDYKAIPILRGFLTARGKMLGGRTTGNCARHQRQLTQGIKRSRMLALLPYTGE
ncbi:MAG: 30S ribosomal protein S18 [Elusimicrobia bacterium]|jgi:small subunit ribosomal protein S18|nr:30S ribosomal protein S18 [Elusimicrobiota bacterium]